MTQNIFAKALEKRANETARFLDEYLSGNAFGSDARAPETLMQAIRHGVLNGGKRLRPFLVMESAALLGADADQSLHAAAGLECLHCYSLIHDDLPSMDDDDLRRGKPTVHKAFDEATAILAGDGLLTLAFELTAHDDSGLDARTRLKLIQTLARDAGIGGMVGGQQLDLENENKTVDETVINRIHAMKTGALLRYACEAGAIIASATPDDLDRVSRYGQVIGLAFQLADDLLDVTADPATMGKATQKDAAAGKNTLIGIHGVEGAEGRLEELVSEAENLLEPYDEAANNLRAAARFVAYRRS